MRISSEADKTICAKMANSSLLKMYILLPFIFQSIFSNCTSSKRQKRFLWITHDRRLIFPPGTVLNLKPTLQVPFLRQEEPPDGIHSDIQISWFFYSYVFTCTGHVIATVNCPFYCVVIGHCHCPHSQCMCYLIPVIFNELGLTHGSHPWPPFYPFGSLFGPSKRSVPSEGQSTVKRSKPTSIMSLPSPSSFPGGERAQIYPKLETLLKSIGWQGRPCLLRLVCETHEYPLKYGYGLLGELFTLFFTVSNSHFAPSHLPSYLLAEEMGRAGNCSNYYGACDKSLFRWEKMNSRNSMNVKMPDNNVLPNM